MPSGQAEGPIRQEVDARPDRGLGLVVEALVDGHERVARVHAVEDGEADVEAGGPDLAGVALVPITWPTTLDALVGVEEEVDVRVGLEERRACLVEDLLDRVVRRPDWSRLFSSL